VHKKPLQNWQHLLFHTKKNLYRLHPTVNFSSSFSDGHSSQFFLTTADPPPQALFIRCANITRSLGRWSQISVHTRRAHIADRWPIQMLRAITQLVSHKSVMLLSLLHARSHYSFTLEACVTIGTSPLAGYCCARSIYALWVWFQLL